MTDKIVYEQPLNERMRTFMRLEFLAQQVRSTVDGTSPWSSRMTLATILDIQSVFSRADIKTELIKELERLGATLERLSQNPSVDTSKLTRVLENIDAYSDRLHATQGPIGQELKDLEILNAVRQRSSIPGGACPFDLPGYHFWIEQPFQRRHDDLQSWLRPYEFALDAAQLILSLLRDSTPPTSEVAAGGFFQLNLDQNTPCQMVRVALRADSPYYAEISAGRHRIAIRFMGLRLRERDVPANEDVPFLLTTAAFG